MEAKVRDPVWQMEQIAMLIPSDKQISAAQLKQKAIEKKISSRTVYRYLPQLEEKRIVLRFERGSHAFYSRDPMSRQDLRERIHEASRKHRWSERERKIFTPIVEIFAGYIQLFPILILRASRLNTIQESQQHVRNAIKLHQGTLDLLVKKCYRAKKYTLNSDLSIMDYAVAAMLEAYPARLEDIKRFR